MRCPPSRVKGGCWLRVDGSGITRLAPAARERGYRRLRGRHPHPGDGAILGSVLREQDVEALRRLTSGQRVVMGIEATRAAWRFLLRLLPAVGHAHDSMEGALVRVDRMVADTPFLWSVAGRRTNVDLGPSAVPVCSAAALHLFQVLADSEKDRMDVRNILTVQGVSERGDLERWARELGTEVRLRRPLDPGAV